MSKKILSILFGALLFLPSSTFGAQEQPKAMEKLWFVQLGGCLGPTCPGESRGACYTRCSEVAEAQYLVCDENPDRTESSKCWWRAFRQSVTCKIACNSNPLSSDDGI
jgi:hypothetical protein